MNPPKILLVSLLIVQEVGKSMGKYYPPAFYDMFGDRTHLIYNGGRASSILCVGGGNPCDREATVQLVDPRGKVMYSRVCNDFKEPYWTIPIAYGFEGKYICRYKRRSVTVDVETINMMYRTCDPLLGCRGEPPPKCPSPPTFCIATNFQENRTCGPIPVQACKVHEPIWTWGGDDERELICPIHADSLCHAMAKNYTRAWAGMKHRYRNTTGRYDTNASCSDTTVPRVQYASQFRPYYDAILLNETEKVISFVYKNNTQLDGSNLSCHIRTKRGIVVDQHFVQTHNVVNLQLNDTLFNSGCNVYKMKCSFIDALEHSGWIIAITSNYLIAIGGHVSIKHDTESDNPDANHTLHCNLRPAPADRDFVVSYYWTVENSTEPLKGQKIIVPLRGWYQCHANIEYSWCAPRHYFKRIIDSERVEFLSTTASALTSIITTPKATTTSAHTTAEATTTTAEATTTTAEATTTTAEATTTTAEATTTTAEATTTTAEATTTTAEATTTTAEATTTSALASTAKATTVAPKSVVTTPKPMARSQPTSSSHELKEKGIWKWKWAIGCVLLKVIGPVVYWHLD